MMSALLLVLLRVVTAAAAAAAAAAAPPPHLIMVVGDDVGVSDVSWGSGHGTGDPTVHSPNLHGLAMAGVRLEAHYLWCWCAPSRSALLSGKLPNLSGFTQSVDGGTSNAHNATTTALDTRYVLLPGLLKAAGYATHGLGKYHLGFATKAHMPAARGFDSWLGYLGGTEDYYHKSTHSKLCGNLTDFWETTATHDGPATDPSYFPRADAAPGDEHSYSAAVYARAGIRLLQSHHAAEQQQGGKQPFFLYLAAQTAHEPSQVPRRFFDLYSRHEPAAAACTWDSAQAGHRRIHCQRTPHQHREAPGMVGR
jgi:arylsulfatase A-like enzyme